MNPPPERRPTQLADGLTSPPVLVPATLVRHFPADRLPDVEAAWSPAREQLAAARRATGAVLESSHWNWAGKKERVERGELTLCAVECEGAIQALMAVPPVPRPSVLTPGLAVLYVDYLEAAPWNQSAPHRPRQFAGAGKVLLGEAVRQSEVVGLDGRVGLHSLPQAERFYEANCRMTRVGPDAGYYDLVYFEYAEGAGSAWLDALGVAR